MNETGAILFDTVSFAYGRTAIFNHADLHIPYNELVWIVGPNGGGKTTLLKLVLGLLAPDSGTIRVLGGPPSAARSRIGYMPQDATLDMRFPISVRDVALMGRLGNGHTFGRFSKHDLGAADRALEMVGLQDVRRRAFSELSGGQLRRLLIARALASEPELLILDEPTANLDALVARELHDLLISLSRNMTVVMVSHDPAFVSEHVKQVICVKHDIKVHPTTRVDSAFLSEIYGDRMRVVQHDRGLHDREIADE
ncbi:MAG: metal ABC transporter ATP-binding protein [candidate division Zixibacteria bacterium]|nr:metal ABC transporter ATP-binding protein [candidate division Zixibacteria bacterium]